MYEVINRDEKLANKIVHSNSDMMFAGVVAGNNSGKVWVDDLEDPAFAMVWSEGLQGFHFMGNPCKQTFIDELKSFFDNTIIRFLKEKDINFLEFSSDREELNHIILNAFSGRKIIENRQYVYKSKQTSLIQDDDMAVKTYSFHQTDSIFISSLKNGAMISNSEFLVDYIEEYWGSVKNYLNLGYGAVAVQDNKIVSFAITSTLYKDTFSIGVETLEQHRRKGLAGTLVKMLVKMLYLKGYNIWWDCMDSNIASQKTAESAGLIFDHEYNLYWFDF